MPLRQIQQSTVVASRRSLGLAVIASSLILAAAPLAARPLLPSRRLHALHISALGSWQLKVDRNRFSGELQCRLYSKNHHIRYASGALGFGFSRHLNTSRATYRIDSEPVRQWRNDLPELVRLSAPIDGSGLDNPTGGIVWIPVTGLRDANRVTIQPRNDRRPRTFPVHGFSGLYAIAEAQGCTPDSRFVP